MALRKVKTNLLICLLLISILYFIPGCSIYTRQDETVDYSLIFIESDTEFSLRPHSISSKIIPYVEGHRGLISSKEVQNLVSILYLDESFVVDMKYATTDNFTKQIIYTNAVCALHKNTAEKLINANKEFQKMGYTVKIWDAYRPPYAQVMFWNLVQDERYVSNPAKGTSRHCRGVAVDITLVDKNGKELEMPSGFDDFSLRAHRKNPNMTTETKANMDLLTKVMKKHGFSSINTEWWHFQDSDHANYPVIDIDFSEFFN